jgi:hypothetical protein
VAKNVNFESTPQQIVATVDLTEACQPHVERAVRTFTLEDRKRLVVTDELHSRQPAGIGFQVMDCRPLPTSPNPEPQADNRNRRKLALHLTEAQDVRIQVTLE